MMAFLKNIQGSGKQDNVLHTPHFIECGVCYIIGTEILAGVVLSQCFSKSTS
jgi:hypothetical protein